MVDQESLPIEEKEILNPEELEIVFNNVLGDGVGSKIYNYILIGADGNSEIAKVLNILIKSKMGRTSILRAIGEQKELYNNYYDRLKKNGFIFNPDLYRSFLTLMKMHNTMSIVAEGIRNTPAEPREVIKFPERTERVTITPEKRLENAIIMASNFINILKANPIEYIGDLAMRHSNGAVQVVRKDGSQLSVQDHTLRTLLSTTTNGIDLLVAADPSHPLIEEYNRLINENFVPALLSVTLFEGKGFTLDPLNTNPNLENLKIKLVREMAWNKELFKYPYLDKLDLSPREDVERREFNPTLADGVFTEEEVVEE